MLRFLFKNVHLKAFFQKVYFKSGPRVHRPPRFWATDRWKFAWHFACRKYAFWRSCLPRKESHTTLILYFDWLMFYAKNEATDIFFVMKPKTGRISLFHAAIITDCVVLWKIQKFDWLISVLKSVPFLHECHFGSAWMSFWPAMPELLPGETRIHSSRVEPEKTIDSKSIKPFHCLTERWYVAIIACCDVPRPCLLQ